MSKKKRKLFIIILVIELLSICFSMPMALKSDKEIVLDAPQSFLEQEVVLPRGVIRVEVDLEPLDVDSIISHEKIDTSFYGVLCNDIFVSKGQSHVEYYLYVMDREAHIKCTVSADGQVLEDFSDISIHLYMTSGLNRVAVLILIFLFVVVDLMLLFRVRVQAGVITKESQFVFFALVGSALLAMLPLFVDFTLFGADGDVHILRIESLAKNLELGQHFPVRIEADCLYDHGYAFSLFYPDLFLYIPALLRVAGFTIMSAYKIYVALIQVLTVFICYKSLMLFSENQLAALFGTILYTFQPYRLYNVYGRSAVGEYTAMAFFPLVGVAIYLLFSKETTWSNYRKIKYLLIIGMTGIIECHVLSTEMVSLCLALICLVNARRAFRKSTLLQIGESILFTGALNAFFLVPLFYMITNDRYVFHDFLVKEIQEKGTSLAAIFQFVPNRGAHQTEMYLAEPIQLGFVGLMLIGVWICMECKYREKSKTKTIMIHTCIVIAVLSILGTRYFPWNWLASKPVIGFFVSAIQFPTRLFALVACALAFFASAFYLRLQELYVNQERIRKIAILLCGILSLLLGVYFEENSLFQVEPIRLYNRENYAKVSVGNAEYLLDDSKLFDYQYHEPLLDDGLNMRNYKKKGLQVDAEIENTSSEIRYVEFPLTGYLGYQIEVDSYEMNVPFINPTRGAHGDLKVAIPGEYKGNLSIRYREPHCFRVAGVISAITWLLFFIGLEYRFGGIWKIAKSE